MLYDSEKYIQFIGGNLLIKKLNRGDQKFGKKW